MTNIRFVDRDEFFHTIEHGSAEFETLDERADRYERDRQKLLDEMAAREGQEPETYAEAIGLDEYDVMLDR